MIIDVVGFFDDVSIMFHLWTCTDSFKMFLFLLVLFAWLVYTMWTSGQIKEVDLLWLGIMTALLVYAMFWVLDDNFMLKISAFLHHLI